MKPVRGDRVYYDFGAEPTTASNEVKQQTLTLKEPVAYFVCIDTTDGSNPKDSGGLYSEEIILPKDCRFVRCALYYKGEPMATEDITISRQPQGKKAPTIDDTKPLEYTMTSQKKCGDTELTYAEFAKLKQLPGTFIRQFTATISIIDSQHIAVATLNDMDMILSLNFGHIVKKRTKEMIGPINNEYGYRPVGIFTPMEVIDREDC